MVISGWSVSGDICVICVWCYLGDLYVDIYGSSICGDIWVINMWWYLGDLFVVISGWPKFCLARVVTRSPCFSYSTSVLKSIDVILQDTVLSNTIILSPIWAQLSEDLFIVSHYCIVLYYCYPFMGTVDTCFIVSIARQSTGPSGVRTAVTRPTSSYSAAIASPSVVRRLSFHASSPSAARWRQWSSCGTGPWWLALAPSKSASDRICTAVSVSECHDTNASMVCCSIIGFIIVTSLLQQRYCVYSVVMSCLLQRYYNLIHLYSNHWM